jgi:hypothetical protein
MKVASTVRRGEVGKGLLLQYLAGLLPYKALRAADALLPGVPVDEGRDPRWQAIIALGDFIEEEPEAVWSFIRRWGAHPQEDLRTAIATCLLEHLLEYHFSDYFPLVEQEALANRLFADTFKQCWRFGQSEVPENAERFAALARLLR